MSQGGVQLALQGGNDGMWIGMGNLKLLDLKRRLQKQGIRAEFRDGKLLCSGGILLSKNGQFDFSIEGPMCPTYYRIRSIVYGLFTFVR